jgi:hypothetical protein
VNHRRDHNISRLQEHLQQLLSLLTWCSSIVNDTISHSLPLYDATHNSHGHAMQPHRFPVNEHLLLPFLTSCPISASLACIYLKPASWLHQTMKTLHQVHLILPLQLHLKNSFSCKSDTLSFKIKIWLLILLCCFKLVKVDIERSNTAQERNWEETPRYYC